MLRHCDLFAGTGAFTLALENTGKVETVYANDMCKNSKVIYDHNFKVKLDHRNLNDVPPSEIPPHDVLTGGFPCQPFSVAGKREGFRDPRSNVFWAIMNIVEHHKPRYVILENVKNLTTHDNGNTIKTVRGALEEKGYSVTWKVVDTAKITEVPQHRERIYLVATLGESPTMEFPVVVKRPVADFLERGEIPAKYYYTEVSKAWELVSEACTERGVVYQYRRVYVRDNKSGECPTLTANMGGGGHNVPLIVDDVGIRKLTPRECFNLQGFPDTYKLPALADCHLYKLAGNAVSYPVARLISQKIMDLN
jgi:DNA (cytosine-5)-methyltransferase 1